MLHAKRRRFTLLVYLCFWSIDEVRMWVFEETLPNGEKLSETINKVNVWFSFSLVELNIDYWMEMNIMNLLVIYLLILWLLIAWL